MNADEARRRATQLRDQEKLVEDQERQKRNEEFQRQFHERSEVRTEAFVADVLKSVKKRVDRRWGEHKILESTDVIPSRRKLTWSGWDYSNCFPLYIQEGCERLRRLGYTVEISVSEGIIPGTFGPSTQFGLRGFINISW
jgi:hypothetical protein